jgi:hypothetical protein
MNADYIPDKLAARRQRKRQSLPEEGIPLAFPSLPEHSIGYSTIPLVNGETCTYIGWCIVLDASQPVKLC